MTAHALDVPRRCGVQQTRTDYLQALWDVAPEFAGAEIEFRPFKGWYATGPARYFGDDGDCLGSNWKEAEKTIRWLQSRDV